jgi:hypothetical protein
MNNGDTPLHTCVREFFWSNAQDNLCKIQDLINAKQGAGGYIENDLGETPIDLLVDHYNKLMSELDEGGADMTEIHYKISYLNRIKRVLDLSR